MADPDVDDPTLPMATETTAAIEVWYDPDKALGLMKQAAIDAWVKDNTDAEIMKGWDGFGHEAFSNGAYRLEVGGGLTFPGDVTYYTRPGADGKGGGEAYLCDGSNSSKMQRLKNDLPVDQVRQRIDHALERWWDLPPSGDGVGFGDTGAVAAGFKDLANSLGVPDLFDAAGPIVDWIGGGDPNLESNTSTLGRSVQDVEHFQGEAVNAFLNGLAIPLPKVIRSYSLIAAYLASTMQAQARSWCSARATVAQAIQTATDNLNAYVNSRSGGQIPAKLVKFAWVVVETASGYMPRAWQEFVSVTGDAVKISGVLDDTTVDNQPGNYEKTMDQFEGTLRKLQRNIDAAEQAIADATIKILEHFQGSAGNNYMLSHGNPTRRVEFPTWRLDPDTIAMSGPVVSAIAGDPGGVLLEVATELDFRRDHHDLPGLIAGIYPGLRRNPRVGLGPSGPADGLRNLALALYDMLVDAAWVCREGARGLRLTYAFQMMNEQHAQVELVQINQNLAGEQPRDPFNYDMGQIRDRMEDRDGKINRPGNK